MNKNLKRKRYDFSGMVSACTRCTVLEKDVQRKVSSVVRVWRRSEKLD